MLPESKTEPGPPDHDSTPPHRKGKEDFVNDVFVEEADALSQEHRDYLLKRHGTIELDPIPDMADADPYNWSTWKVLFFLSLSLWMKM